VESEEKVLIETAPDRVMLLILAARVIPMSESQIDKQQI